MATMDIFTSNAFSTFSLTNAINKVDYKPQRLGQLNIFAPMPVRTISIGIEAKDSVLSLIPTSERGAPLPQQNSEKRNIRDFRTRRIAKGDRLHAYEIQNVRAFGSETELMQVQAETAQRMQRLRNDVELTHENMRLGAVQGKFIDSDGSTILDWFTEFSIAPPAEIDFDLDNATPGSGAVRKLCNQVTRAMMRGAKGAWTPQTQIIGMAGDNFWDDLTAHKEVRETYLNTAQAQDLRPGNAFETFRYGGITWENYRGTDDNATVAVGADKAIFFPVGATAVFEVAYSPAEFMPWVNTLGEETYAMMIPDRDRQAYIDIETYSYPLFICKRPQMLQKARRT